MGLFKNYENKKRWEDGQKMLIFVQVNGKKKLTFILLKMKWINLEIMIMPKISKYALKIYLNFFEISNRVWKFDLNLKFFLLHSKG